MCVCVCACVCVCVLELGPGLSIGETEGVRIITKQVSKLSCVSLANHEIAVSSFEVVQIGRAHV